ncbi:MAG: FAD-binding protein [Solirubrobacterales bacterium]|jgi:glycolate oxidase subunit GlcD|nr:FAD-binding protein [Solirubrobacterales bacterium]
MSSAVASDLAGLVGSEHVRHDAHFLADASQAMGLRGEAAAVVLPGDAAEVAAVVAWCYERGVAVVPRGGGTGYAGGAVPLDPAHVVLALDRLDRVRSFEPGLWRMEAEAGVTTQTVARLARENGLVFPPDPGAAEQSHLGGNIATNAGGPHCFKYGVTRAWVSGVEAVIAPGELVRFGGPLRKDVAGYDLTGLLCGSEGTLGIVTSAWLRLLPAPQLQLPVVGAFAGVEEGCEAIERVLASGVVPATIEYLDAGALAASASTFPGGLPDGTAFLVVCEADTSEADAAELEEALAGELGRALRPSARELWRWRDGVSLAVTARRGGKLSEDVAVPLDRLAAGITGTVAIAERHGLEGCSWGHAGDGNLHSTFLLEPGDTEQLARAEAAVEELFALAIALGGSVSGEHGLGWLKRGQLRNQWAPAAVGAHEAIKAALDPKGLFNPGKKTA